MKVLITGGGGFIGTYIVNLLYKKRYEVAVIDSFKEQIHGKNYTESYLYKSILNKANIYMEDILISKSLRSLIVEADYIIHLAAETGTGQSMYEINNYVNVNSVGTARLLEYIVKNKNKIKKFILASSRSVYGEGEYICKKHGVVFPDSRKKEDLLLGNYEPLCPFCNSPVQHKSTTENCKINPKSIYAVTKFNQEQLVKTTCESIDLPYTVFRFQNVYGKGQSINNPYTGILSIFSKLIMENKTIDIFEDGLESRDFIHVSDIANAVYMDLNSSVINQTYNVGSGKQTTVLDVVKILQNGFNKKINYTISGNFRLGDIRHNYADINKIKRKLGFVPKVSLEKGIKELVNWIKEEYKVDNNYNNYEKSLNEMAKFNLLVKKNEV